MYGLSEISWQRWRRKRRSSLIGFVIIGLFLGIDCSVVFSTLYIYLKDLVKTDKPQLWYGLIVSFYYVSSSVAGAVWGRWLDRSRNVKFYVTVSLLVQVIGFLLYAVPFSPVCLLIGRTICGVGDPFTSVIAGEIFRVYDSESTRPIFLISSVYPLGFLIGPSLNFLFTSVDFRIGQIVINKLNFVGIFMPCVIVIVIALAQYLVHDCSKEFDLKEHVRKINANKSVNTETKPLTRTRVDSHTLITSGSLSTSTPSDVPQTTTIGNGERVHLLSSTTVRSIPISQVLRTLISNKDTLLVFISTVVLMYTLFAATALLPILASDVLDWSLKSLSILYTSVGICDIVCFLLMATFCKTTASVYGTCLASIVCHIVLCCLLICIKILDRNPTRDLILMIALVPTSTVCWTFDGVLIRVTFAKMVPSTIQSFSETLRVAFSKGARIAGSFTVAVMMPWLQWWSVAVISIMVPIFIVFVLRWRYLHDPTEISFFSDYHGISVKRKYDTLVEA